MTQEDKELLLKDLCARLPYGVHLFTNSKHHIRLLTIDRDLDYDEQYWINGLYDIDEVKPYLRPMSSMTEEETETLWNIWENDAASEAASKMTDFLNKKHLDHHHLIDKGLAIEVTKESI